jgi:hypothetical protein
VVQDTNYRIKAKTYEKKLKAERLKQKAIEAKK